MQHHDWQREPVGDQRLRCCSAGCHGRTPAANRSAGDLPGDPGPTAVLARRLGGGIVTLTRSSRQPAFARDSPCGANHAIASHNMFMICSASLPDQKTMPAPSAASTQSGSRSGLGECRPGTCWKALRGRRWRAERDRTKEGMRASSAPSGVLRRIPGIPVRGTGWGFRIARWADARAAFSRRPPVPGDQCQVPRERIRFVGEVSERGQSGTSPAEKRGWPLARRRGLPEPVPSLWARSPH